MFATYTIVGKELQSAKKIVATPTLIRIITAADNQLRVQRGYVVQCWLLPNNCYPSPSPIVQCWKFVGKVPHKPKPTLHKGDGGFHSGIGLGVASFFSRIV